MTPERTFRTGTPRGAFKPVPRTLTPPMEYELVMGRYPSYLRMACRRFIQRQDYAICSLTKDQRRIKRINGNAEVAVQYPYVVPNRYGCFQYIVVDIDYNIVSAMERQAEQLI